MSKISDELRDYGRRLVSNASPFNCTFGDIRAYQDELADRIDAEMVELPQSADGKIWTGRETCFWTGAADGDWHKFNSLAYIDDRWCVEDSDFERYPAVSVWYERPDSLERIADELDEQAGSLTKDGYTWQEDAIHDFAVRIRKLAEKEGE